MKIKDLASINLLQKHRIWLLGIAISFIALHISLTWQLTTDIDRLSISILAWGAFLFLVWNRRSNLNLESGFAASLLGIVLVVLVLLKSLSVFWFESDWLRLLPVGLVLGLALLSSGFKGLKQYWREFLIVFILAIPEGLLLDPIEKIAHVSLLTAKVGTLVLWYLGFEVTRQGVYILLPTGAVEVYPGCSGLSTMFLLLRLSILYLVLFPTKLIKTLLIPLAAVFLAYVVNAVRVALMAFLVAASNQTAFKYWHTGDGSQVFSMIAVLAFGLLCTFLIKQDENEVEPQAPSS